MEQSLSLSGKKILVVDDEADLRDVVSSILLNEGAELQEAGSGDVAQDMIGKTPYDLIISDVRMPGSDGVSLLKYVRSTHPNTKFVMFTGFAEALEAQTAYELGANGFLAKPFRMKELLQLVTELFKSTPTPKIVGANAPLYCRIAVEDFLTTSRLPSDVYVCVADGKYVKVAHEGSQIEVSRIRTYKDRKVDYFYVMSTDFYKYSGLNLRISKATAKTDQISNEQKLKVFSKAGQILMQQVFISGLEKELCADADVLLQNTLRITADSPDLLEMFVQMQSQGDAIFAHSVGVSVYAGMIGKKLGWKSAQTQYKLAMAGLFHNIGMKEIPQELLEKPRVKMTAAEIKIIESHPARGRDLLLSMPEFPSDLAQIVYQHHENQAGTGYPLGIGGIKIHPLAKVLRVADEFCERAAAAHCKSIGDVEKILGEIVDQKSIELDSEALCALFEVFGLPRPSKARLRALA